MTRRLTTICALLAVAAAGALGIATVEAGEPGVNASVDFANLTRDRGDDLEIITTLYGPPAWATKQKFIRGRDLDPARKENLAQYITAWVKYIHDEEKFPVKYVSIHNEGDSPNRWPADGKSGNIGTGHDYNAWRRPWTVAGFLPILRSTLDGAGLGDGVTPGECTVSGSGVELIGFASNATKNPDALVVLNTVRWGSQPIRVRVLGNDSASFRGYLTTGDLEKKYEDQGSFDVEDGYVKLDLPALSSAFIVSRPTPSSHGDLS